MIESAIVTYHGVLVSATKGKPGSVEFDFEAVWAFKKRHKEGFNPRWLNWVHVHPIGFGPGASEQDQLCAASLVAAFGDIDNFGIVCFENSKPNSLHGDILWHSWDKSSGRLVGSDIGDIVCRLEDRDAYILKSLSFGDLWKSQFTDLEPSAVTSSSSSQSSSQTSAILESTTIK